MDLHTEMMGALLLVTPKIERLDGLRAPEFREQMIALVEGKSLVVLDLSQILFIDGAGLEGLVDAMRGITESAQLRLAEPTWQVRNVLRLTRLDRVFHIYSSVEEAAGVHKKAARAA